MIFLLSTEYLFGMIFCGAFIIFMLIMEIGLIIKRIIERIKKKMSGTKEGGIKARDTNIARHGDNYYAKIGQRGGSKCVAKGFSMNPELAKRVGKIGGKISKRGKAKKNEKTSETEGCKLNEG